MKTDTTINPYVYRLDNQTTNEFYIGFRAANKVPAEHDLGYKYFSSSKLVKHRFNEFTATIIAEFFDADAAYEFEQELIFEAWGTAGLLNKQHRHGSKGSFNTTGMTHTDETRQKISEANKGRPMSDELRRKLSEINMGNTHSDASKLKCQLRKWVRKCRHFLTRPGRKCPMRVR